MRAEDLTDCSSTFVAGLLLRLETHLSKSEHQNLRLFCTFKAEGKGCCISSVLCNNLLVYCCYITLSRPSAYGTLQAAALP